MSCNRSLNRSPAFRARASEPAGDQGGQRERVRFLNLQVAKDLAQGKALRIDVGSGRRPQPGFYGLDEVEFAEVDIAADLNKPLDLLPNDCAEHIFSSHALEHVRELIPLLAEFHRITRHGGILEIIVPHFSNAYFYSDPTHVRFFGLYTLNYFVEMDKQPGPHKVPTLPTSTRFELDSVRISFYRFNLFDRLVVPFLRYFANRTPASQHCYELRWSRLFPASELTFKLRVSKP